MVRNKVGMSIGFSKRAPTPALIAVNSWFGRAVTMMMGISGCSAVRRSKVSHPFLTGMFRSSKTRSMDECLANSSARSPFSAGVTPYPSATRTSCSESRTVGSSSTNRTCLVARGLSGATGPGHGLVCTDRWAERTCPGLRFADGVDVIDTVAAQVRPRYRGSGIGFGTAKNFIHFHLRELT
jgi:hypothetical protein